MDKWTMETTTEHLRQFEKMMFNMVVGQKYVTHFDDYGTYETMEEVIERKHAADMTGAYGDKYVVRFVMNCFNSPTRHYPLCTPEMLEKDWSLVWGEISEFIDFAAAGSLYND